MRILFVTHYALPHVGGVEVVVDQLAGELRRQGHEVEHLAARSRESKPGTAVPPGNVHMAAAWNVVEARTGLPYPLCGPGLVSLARRWVRWADVVHAHGFLFETSAVALGLASRRAKREGVPARVLTEHGGPGVYESQLLRAVESAAIHSLGAISLRSAQAVIALNPRVGSFVQEKQPGKEVLEIPNGVDAAVYRPASAKEREALRASLGWDARPRALFVGRLVPRKGADLAVEAARMMLDEVELVLVGPGDTPGLPENAVAMGELPSARVADLYRAADFLLLPSTAEGFPLTAQEALASGLPVVLADDPAYGAYLDSAPEGVLRVERTADALVEAMREVEFGNAIGPEQRQRLVEFARARFSWSRSAEAHEQLYRRLLPEGHEDG